MFRARHKVVFAHGGFSRGLHSRKGRLPTSWLGYWSYKVSKKNGQNPRNVHELADHGGKGYVWERDRAGLDSLGQLLARSRDGGST